MYLRKYKKRKKRRFFFKTFLQPTINFWPLKPAQYWRRTCEDETGLVILLSGVKFVCKPGWGMFHYFWSPKLKTLCIFLIKRSPTYIQWRNYCSFFHMERQIGMQTFYVEGKLCGTLVSRLHIRFSLHLSNNFK